MCISRSLGGRHGWSDSLSAVPRPRRPSRRPQRNERSRLQRWGRALRLVRWRVGAPCHRVWRQLPSAFSRRWRPCNSASDALCEPYDWLMNGEGKARRSCDLSIRSTVSTVSWYLRPSTSSMWGHPDAERANLEMLCSQLKPRRRIGSWPRARCAVPCVPWCVCGVLCTLFLGRAGAEQLWYRMTATRSSTICLA